MGGRPGAGSPDPGRGRGAGPHLQPGPWRDARHRPRRPGRAGRPLPRLVTPGVRVAVVGGGIAGLAAAWELCSRAEVTVYEPGRLGGKILTTPFRGRPV